MTTSTATATSGEVTTEQVQARIAELMASCDPASVDRKTFLGAKYDAGLAWIWFPEGSGGMGASPRLQAVVEKELAAAGAPSPNFIDNPIGLGMAAPTVVTHGTEEQKALLRDLYCGTVWCQLFSEPGAGSDLAGLATRAIRDGDEWVVNGQKVWTTVAHLSKYGLLVARTDPDLPKHQGLTYFIVDMEAPGVEVRPLYQITGEAEFNEVYMTDVRIPDTMRLGGVGDGWRVSMTTLMNERVAIGGSDAAPRGSGVISLAVKTFQHYQPGPVERDQLMQLWVEAEVNRLTNLRAGEMRRKGTPGPEGSVAKLAFAELNKKIGEFCVTVMGADGMLFPRSYEKVRPKAASLHSADVRYFFLRSRANSIEGGTSEVLRNVLGERVLGLPGEPRTDKDLPWKDVPR